MKWTEKYSVRFHDANANDILGASQIFKYVQETAMRQMRACRPSYTDLLNENKALILSNMRLEIYAPIYSYDEIEVKTWACPSRGFTTTRSYEIWRGNELMCEGNSVWALVSVTDKRLLKVTEMSFDNFEPEEPLALDKPVKVRIPSEVKMSLVGEYTIRYTDTDLNGHMNNTNYPDMIFNCLPSPDSFRISGIAISYIKEAKIGDNLKIYIANTDGRYYFRSVHEDGSVNVEGEITLEKME